MESPLFYLGVERFTSIETRVLYESIPHELFYITRMLDKYTGTLRYTLKIR